MICLAIPSKTIYAEAPQIKVSLKDVDKNKIQKIIEVADEKGIAREDLLGISKHESDLCRILIGDGGKSKGCFHINTAKDANPEALPIIGNIRKEAEWVADKLLSYGYPEKRTLAIAKYNAPSYPDLSNSPKSYVNLVKQKIEWVKNNI